MVAAARSLWSKNSVRQLACMLALLPVFFCIYYFAYWLRFEGIVGNAAWRIFLSTVFWVVSVKCIVFGWFGVYRGWGRFVTFHDLVMLIQAAVGSSLLMAMGDYLLFPSLAIPRSVFLMDWGATLLVVGALRAVLRLLQEGKRLFFLPDNTIPVLIVGADGSGEALLRALRMNGALPYRVVGFIAQQQDRATNCIGGVPVLGTLEETRMLAELHGVAEVLIATGDLAGREVRALVEECRQGCIAVKVLPSMEDLLKGTLATQPRAVSIQDLLRREPVRLETEDIREWIDHEVLMVTGSAGSIGSEVCRQLLKFSPRKLILVDRWENGQFFIERELRRLNPQAEIQVFIADISDENRMRRIFEEHAPDVLFHAAAYKHVPLMESNPGEAVKNTALATYSLASLADEFKVKSFVMISTDKAVNPTNVMGACKRVAELYCQSLAETSACRFVTVRFGNVLDSSGSVVQIFREQIAWGGPVTVTDPRVQRYFMTIPEAAQLVIQAGTMGQGGEIFVLDMGEPVHIVDLASDMIRLSGLKVGEDIEIEFVGLRPGEKLFEELHADGERHLPTRHPKILVAERRQQDPQSILAAMHRLRCVVERPTEMIVASLRQIVPEYQPSTHQETAPYIERRAA